MYVYTHREKGVRMKALEYPKVFKVLLNGGHICAIVGNNKTTYSVVTGNGGSLVGHITEKQFRELNLNEVIEHHIDCDQRGNNYEYRYWGLKA